MSGETTTKIWTASNVITMIRIMLVPVFIAVLLAPWPEWFGLAASFTNDWKSIVAAAIFVLISCTDWLDGYLARSRNEVTDFGKFMDPLADKILVAAALISLVELGSLPTWVVMVILAREFIISGVRMMAASKGVVIAASMLGKFKTVFQMIAIVLFTIKDSHMIGSLHEALHDTLWVVSWIVMLIALFLTVASMFDYLVKARDVIGLGPSEDKGEADAETGEGGAEGSVGVSVGETDEASLAERVIGKAIEANVTIATAESLTGGGIGSALTSVAGSSAVYKGGIVSYVNDVKHGLLGVDAEVLDSEGAVCETVAMEMARGARERLKADIAVSVTGIAGPGGAEPGKPVGTVWIGVSTKSSTTARLNRFEGDRQSVRRQTEMQALLAISDAIDA